MDIPTSIRLPNFNLDTRHNTVLIQEVWSDDDGNEWEDALTGGSNLEVFPGQPRASCQDEGGREEGDEEVRWLYDRQGVSGREGGGRAARKWVRKRETEHGRDYSAVYSNGQSDPHQSQRAPPNIPDTLV